MASLSPPNLISPVQKQAEIMQEHIAHRSEIAGELKEVESILSKAIHEIQSSHQNAGELILELQKKAPNPTDQLNQEAPTEQNTVATLSELVQFSVQLKKTASIEKIYPEIFALNKKSRAIEAEAAQLEEELKHLKEVKERMAKLLEKKREKAQLIKAMNTALALSTKV